MFIVVIVNSKSCFIDRQIGEGGNTPRAFMAAAAFTSALLFEFEESIVGGKQPGMFLSFLVSLICKY